MMTINIIINGANGKMGRTAVAAIAHEKELTLVAATTRTDNLRDAIQQHHAHVVIDFTEPSAAFHNTKIIIEAGARPVVGTTGFSDDEIDAIRAICSAKKHGAIIAPNFSIGALLTMKYAQDAAKYFSDVEIIEYHHPQKKDKPSGTARKTAQLIRSVISQDIPIHSVRLPGIFAKEEIIFGGNNETLTLQHHTTDRNAMMAGLFLC